MTLIINATKYQLQYLLKPGILYSGDVEMSQKDKLIVRLKSKPKDFSFDEVMNLNRRAYYEKHHEL